MKFRIIKTKKEKSIEEIVNGLNKNDTHIKVSEKMFELLRKKWDGVLTTSTTLTILFEDEEKRFRHKVSDIIEKISTKERSTDDYFNFIDMNKVGLD